MKKILVVLSVLVAGTYGANAQSALKVRLTDNRQINVALDGRYFAKTGTSITVGDLPPGRHSLDIYTVGYSHHGRARQQLVYSGNINTYTNNMTLFSFDPYSEQIQLQEQDMSGGGGQPPMAPPVPPAPDNTGYNNGGQQGGYNNNNYNNNAPANNGDDNNYVAPQSPGASPVTMDEVGTLTDAKTDDLKKQADAKKTDTEKMNLLKSGLKDEKINTNQVSLMMDWLNFESSKVEFAKSVYAQTVDKENYANLLNKFTYKNYQDELDKFIRDMQK